MRRCCLASAKGIAWPETQRRRRSRHQKIEGSNMEIRMNRHTAAALAALSLAALALPPTAWAQYPAKPIRVVVSTVPGPLDAFARIICDKVSAALKQPMVVENRAGAGGNIAAETVMKTPADGYTLLFSLDTTFTVNPAIYKKLPFDPVKDF